jgi:hypothetical protein
LFILFFFFYFLSCFERNPSAHSRQDYNLYMTAQLYANGEPLVLPVQTGATLPSVFSYFGFGAPACARRRHDDADVRTERQAQARYASTSI